MLHQHLLNKITLLPPLLQHDVMNVMTTRAYTTELQWLKQSWDHINEFQPTVVLAIQS